MVGCTRKSAASIFFRALRLAVETGDCGTFGFIAVDDVPELEMPELERDPLDELSSSGLAPTLVTPGFALVFFFSREA